MIALILAPSSAAVATRLTVRALLLGMSAPFFCHLMLVTVAGGGTSTPTLKVAVPPTNTKASAGWLRMVGPEAVT